MSSTSYVLGSGVGGHVRFDETGRLAVARPGPAPRPVKASRTPLIVIASAVGLIAFLALMLLLAGLTLTGCASSPEARRLAHELRAQIAVNRAVSDPKPGVDPAKWARGQDAAASAAASLEKEVQ